MNAVVRWACWIGATLGGGAAIWSLYELVTADAHLVLVYQVFFFLLALFNLVPISGVLVGRALDGMPSRQRIITVVAWAIPALIVLLIDLLVIAITVGKH